MARQEVSSTVHLQKSLARPTGLVIGLLAVGLVSGCKSTYGLDPISHDQWMRQAERSALDGKQLSYFSALAVKQRNLSDAQKRRPDEVIETLHGELLQTRSRPVAATLAEACYLRAKQMKQRSPESTRLYMTAALLAWSYLFDDGLDPAVNPYDERFHLARGIYNHALSKAIYNLREAGARWGKDLQQDTLLGPVQFDFGINELSWQTDRRSFDKLLLAYEFNVRGLQDHLRTSGLGVPMILVRQPPPPEEATPQDRFLPQTGEQAFPATALVRLQGSMLTSLGPGEVRRVTIDIFDPTRTQQVTIKGRPVALETDTTTPLAYRLGHTPLLKGMKGLMDATAWKDRRGLYMLMPYQRGKIPVVFVHGLMSSPLTWLPMVNNLLGDEDFRRHYQIWYFLYPTANPILYNAATLRASLKEAQALFDPGGTDPAFNDMVFVGHSMGGLLSRLNMASSGDTLWAAIFVDPLDDFDIDDKKKELIEELMFFEPLPFLRRVIFIASPHRGSNLADTGISRFFASMIHVDKDLEEAIPGAREHMKKDSREAKQTSVWSLSEVNPALRALDEMPMSPDIKYHSIIANEEAAGTPGGTDTIVPYKSSHLEGAESELIIHGVHTCTGHPDAIREVRRILLLHAAEFAARQGVSAPPQ